MKALSKFSFFAMFAIAIILASCTKDEVSNLTLTKQALDIKTGQSDSLLVNADFSGNVNPDMIILSVSDPKIIKAYLGFSQYEYRNTSSFFQRNIVVKGLSAGSATLTIQVGGKSVTATVTVGENLTFGKSQGFSFGDFYDTGAKTNKLYLLPNDFIVSTNGDFTGVGKYLVLEFSSPLSAAIPPSGNYIASDTHVSKTFYPSINDSCGLGGCMFINSVTNDTTLVKSGSFAITLISSTTYKVEGNLLTKENESISFSYTGALTFINKVATVKATPTFKYGKLSYFGDYYNSKLSSNYLLQLYNKDASTDEINEMLYLEVNAPLGVQDSLVSKTYTVMSSVDAFLNPFTIIPGIINNNVKYNSWYYNSGTSIQVRTGSMNLSRADNIYHLSYEFYDRFGSKVSGTYNDTLNYVSKFSTPSNVKRLTKSLIVSKRHS